MSIGTWRGRAVLAGFVALVAAAAVAATFATRSSNAAGLSAKVDNKTLVYAITDTPPDIDPNSSAGKSSLKTILCGLTTVMFDFFVIPIEDS